MKDKNPLDFGKQLGQMVQDATRTGDYSQLKSAIDVTVQEIQRTVSSAINQQIPKARPPFYPNPRVQRTQVVYQQPPRPVQPAQPVPQQRVVYNGTVLPQYTRGSLPGSVASVLLLVFGILGLTLTGFTTIISLPILASEGMGLGFLATACSLIPLDVGFLAMIGAGKSIHSRNARFKRYQMILRGARYFSLEQLASACGVTKDFLVRDLRRMMRKGLFRDAYIDDQETCIMLDRETYQQYLTTRQHLEQRRLEEESRIIREEQEKAQAASAPPDSAAAVVAEGRNYIRQIKAANDAIPNQEISAKLDRLETVTSKVFAYVEGHPNKLPEIRKFMNYYLPTTLKLVNAYREFDSQPVNGDNITAAKREIGEILDTINTAFENLLDSLFADDAMDISSDISALSIMLAQDGLTGSDFNVGKTPEI